MKDKSEHIHVYQAALEKWGDNTQAMMAMGECGELIAALNRVYTQGRDEMDSVCEEIADVEIMIGQLRLMIGDEKIDSIKADKIDRLSCILDGSVYHPHGSR